MKKKTSPVLAVVLLIVVVVLMLTGKAVIEKYVPSKEIRDFTGMEMRTNFCIQHLRKSLP